MGEMGEVVIRGQILSMDERPIRGEKTILMFSITDFTDTIMVKMFCKDEYLKEIKDGGDCERCISENQRCDND